MEKIIKLLTAINDYYKKFLYILIPSVMIVLNFLDLVFLSIGKGSLYVTANVVIIAATLILTARYLYYHKEELFCLCGTLSTAYISIILFISHFLPDVPLIAVVLFIGVYVAALVVTFMVRAYEMHRNGR
ncbi:MAG: hypothetical protein NC253_07340 [Ruminococcus sp.]|nr:hypothetical protein [Ruminococcus sp.]MCM1380550.1 hypothetical protein [Muribaculaceae bacterium]MCM1480780.1 hypothetical protein [Muribaculaceae bacterium]